MQRQVQLFMTPTDEEDFLTLLRERIPGIKVIDGQRWDAPVSAVRDRMADCRSNDVYLWGPSVAPELPSKPRPGGGFQGPQNGPVIQWIRGRTQDEMLGSGRLAASAFDPLELTFAVRFGA